jgi:histidine triad (HIT) family protein
MPESDCLFCKIRDGKISAKIVHRDEYCLGFEDINAQAPTHVLLIPLQHIETLNDLSVGDAEKMGHLILAAVKIAKERGHAEKGYRLVTNCNRDGGQRVFHVHFHLLGGRVMGWPPG